MTGKFMAALAQVIVFEEFVCKSINSSDVQVSELGYYELFLLQRKLVHKINSFIA